MSDLNALFVAPLIDIRDHATALSHSAPLNDNQRAFIHHIAQMAHHLYEHFSAMPPSITALQHILPPQQERLQAQLASLYGYARLLLEQPLSFGGAPPTPAQRAHLSAIDRLALGIARACDDIAKDALDARRAGHAQPAQSFHLAALSADYEPIWRYYLNPTAVTLSVEIDAKLPAVWGYPYHTAALMTHLVLTIGRELIADGELKARAIRNNDVVAFVVSCAKLSLSDADLETLFSRNGRAHYRTQIARGGGQLLISRQTGQIASVGFTLPIDGRAS